MRVCLAAGVIRHGVKADLSTVSTSGHRRFKMLMAMTTSRFLSSHLSLGTGKGNSERLCTDKETNKPFSNSPRHVRLGNSASVVPFFKALHSPD